MTNITIPLMKTLIFIIFLLPIVFLVKLPQTVKKSSFRFLPDTSVSCQDYQQKLEKLDSLNSQSEKLIRVLNRQNRELQIIENNTEENISNN